LIQNSLNGKCIIVTAPSGAGKTTIVRHLLSINHSLSFSVSACNRPQRSYEINGRDYYYYSTVEFLEKVKNNEFLEWQEVYEKNYYGTLKSEIERIWGLGKHVIFDVDVEGALNLKNIFGNKALAIFIKPPSVESLKNRLAERNTETPETLAKRISKATKELEYSNRFDKVILNDDLIEALALAESYVFSFISDKK
jgi:guanylate kinase